MKKYLILLVIPLLFSCENTTPNYNKRADNSGKAYDAGESPSMNVYDIEHHGYRIWIFKEIYNNGETEKFVGAMLDPRYIQKPMYEITQSIKIDTLQDLTEPININLKD
jgi:hypothetical protein